MDGQVQTLLNRISLVSAAVATLSLLYLFSHTSLSCRPLDPRHRDALALTFARTPFPRSSCEAAARRPLPPDKRSKRLQSTRDWRRRVDSYAALFATLRSRGVLGNASRVLCVAAGAGHDVAALWESGVGDVTGVDLVDVPPLVRRCDPHNLPFFDGVFDLGFSAGLDEALFPARFVEEMERTVRRGGGIVLVVERCSSEEEVEEVRALFKRSTFLGVGNATLVGSEMTVIMMKRKSTHP
ncbi:hypothetical protein Taro_028225 [Colocasia esculenta]|uniref:Methyltransferase type 11 domain-containing protein n=1 Tax=Colocasia esculenta TaxID=4460 RepID=A0A843VWM2_COLES|nr:hypothetical protein [Colocasia esculenta]